MTAAAKTYKEKANDAFKAKKWEEAIYNYTKSLELDPSSHVNYSNRSAAYLKAKDFGFALKDANMCIKLKRGYHKGYLRKGSTYHAMEKYELAAAAFKEGLKVCENEPQLQKGLAAARKAKLENTSANKAARRTKATQMASRHRSTKASKARTVSHFIEETRKELKLQLASIQAQLDLVDELSRMGDDEKLDLLFGFIDTSGDGLVDAKELAEALRKKNENLNLKASLERAMSMVAAFDTDGDFKLDHDEFKNCIGALVGELDTDFHELCEFLVLRMFNDTTDTGVKENETVPLVMAETNGDSQLEGELFDMLLEDRMKELFKLFDKNGSRAISFADVAIDLHVATRGMGNSVRTTMGLLLLMDPRDDRKLTYEQFARLIMTIVVASGSTFDDIAEDLMIGLTEKKTISDVSLSDLFIDDSVFATAKEIEQEAKSEEEIIDALSYGRLQKLFDLWDIDGNGQITMNELYRGLKKFQDAADIKDDVKKQAMDLLGFDRDGDLQLGRREFAHAMVHYAKVLKVDLQELIDFMCVSSVLKENAHSYQKAYGKALIGKNIPAVQPASMEYFDEWGDDDFWDDY